MFRRFSCVAAVMLIATAALAQSPKDTIRINPTIQNDDLKTCVGILEAHGQRYWPAALVNCGDAKYTRWIEQQDAKKGGSIRLQNADLKTCLGVREDWGAPFWRAIVVPCNHRKYTNWTIEQGKIKNLDLGTCLGVQEAHGQTFWPVVLVQCSDAKYTKWTFAR